MSFIKKIWKNFPDISTPINATGLNNLEDRIYKATESTTLTVTLGSVVSAGELKAYLKEDVLYITGYVTFTNYVNQGYEIARIASAGLLRDVSFVAYERNTFKTIDMMINDAGRIFQRGSVVTSSGILNIAVAIPI